MKCVLQSGGEAEFLAAIESGSTILSPLAPLDVSVPEEWRKFEQSALSGTVLVVGATDTGKSTLARWLFEKARQNGRTPAWLDGDVGQSSLGLPGTLNVVMSAVGSADAEERKAFFIGNTSPRGHMLPILTGLCRLRDWARSQGADPIVIDTSGLVAQEHGGGALKEWEVELLMPTTIIALQRGRELEHLLLPWRHDSRFRLHILPVAAMVRRRSPQERTERRQILFRRFFEGARALRFIKGQKPIYGLQSAEPGCLIGLIGRDGFLLGAGVVSQILSNGLEVVSSIGSPGQVTVVRLGKLRINPSNGAELHRTASALGESEE